MRTYVPTHFVEVDTEVTPHAVVSWWQFGKRIFGIKVRPA